VDLIRFHRSCVFHKQRKFQSQVDHAQVIPETRDEALRLSDTLFKHQSHKEVEEAVEKIHLLVPSISEYLDAEIVARIGLFTEVFKHSALTMGYRATIFSESANHMIRGCLAAPVFGLPDLKWGITNAYGGKKEYPLAVATSVGFISMGL
jgi:hypothetical protein